MLHKGWTICLGRDPFDDDWQFFVKKGEFLSLQEFVDAGDPALEDGAIEASIPTREEALKRAKQCIEDPTQR
jgi:hypothetical protein